MTSSDGQIPETVPQASTGGETPVREITPQVSARGKHNKETFRDMVLKAADYAQGKNGAATFKAISDYIDREFHVRNDFLVLKTLNQLVELCLLDKHGGKYCVRELKFSPNQSPQKRKRIGKKRKRGGKRFRRSQKSKRRSTTKSRTKKRQKKQKRQKRKTRYC